VISAIDFRFGGGLTISAGNSGTLEALLGAAPVVARVPLGGTFADGPVTISAPAAPGPLPFAGAAAALAWSHRLRLRIEVGQNMERRLLRKPCGRYRKSIYGSLAIQCQAMIDLEGTSNIAIVH
jgi:hypothetical protein